jgi:hypothetical protein
VVGASGQDPGPRTRRKWCLSTPEAGGTKPVRWLGLAPTRNGYEPRTGLRATLYPFPYHTLSPPGRRLFRTPQRSSRRCSGQNTKGLNMRMRGGSTHPALQGIVKAGALRVGDPGHCRDVTPRTHLNRMPLCQGTLSIGPYLLLKVQFQHPFCSRTH